MARTKRWKDTFKDGCETVTLSSWRWFTDFINSRLLDYTQFIYRGQSSDRWPLQSSLERLLDGATVGEKLSARSRQLRNFKLAVRGRRGAAPAPLENDNEWWALGQHNGLATPLLDWTESPFVALYFAFEDEAGPDVGHRAVWALSTSSVINRSSQLQRDYGKAAKDVRGAASESSLPNLNQFLSIPLPETLEIIQPNSDENARLVSQRALFVKGPGGISIDDWVSKHFKNELEFVHLFKIRIPNKARETCLRSLNRMNINRLSLFPDLGGASEYCNKSLRIKNY